MNQFNDIGISRKLDVSRIKKLLSIGLFASVLHFAGDMILGWGVEDETLTGILRMLSAYTGTSDGGIFAAALLGLFGMVLEGLAYFGVFTLYGEPTYIIFNVGLYHIPKDDIFKFNLHNEPLVVRTCLVYADCVGFSDYCLIGARQKGFLCGKGLIC